VQHRQPSRKQLTQQGTTPTVTMRSSVAWHDANGDDAFFRGIARGANATARQYVPILGRRDAFIATMEQFFRQWDALLCPATLSLATLHAPLGEPVLIHGTKVPYWTGTMAHCCPFNLTGHPALVVPAGHSSEGLPIGIQVVGRLLGEMELFAIRARLGDVLEPFHRPLGY
jgi:amidase